MRKTRLELIKSKVHSNESLLSILAVWKLKNEKIVFTNGCFDILHQGHIDYLCKAADLGTKLIVGVNSDASTKRLQKGSSRPIQDEVSRALLIAALHVVDAVILFDEDTPLNLISTVMPNVLVKGSDYEVKNIVGYNLVTNAGGEVLTVDFLPGYSTSSIEAKIKNV